MAPAKPPKSPKQTPTRPGPGGRGELRIGNPGNKGGGRTPDEFKARMQAIASRKEALDYLERCADGLEGPKAALAAQQYAAERGFGKVPNVTKLETGPEPLRIVVERA